MITKLKRLFCQHEMYWSERRRGHACYKCGRFRMATLAIEPAPDAASGPALPIPPAMVSVAQPVNWSE
ncbi:hypothetical protein [Brevundimonas lenta]|uniref:hypothetical protein n=1 Tax=Brevundimonas lenta TaxID=424796 RepID=UPI00160684B7|nr:hypothetical protein [Brevundimonas lenta]